MIDRELFNEWKQHPMTRALMDVLEAKRDILRRQWEGGSFTDYDKGTTALVNVGNVGICRGLAFVAELTYEDYVSEIEDGEQERVGAARSGGADQNV